MYGSKTLNAVYRANVSDARPWRGRDGLGQYLGAGGGEPSIWQAANYPAWDSLDFQDYWVRYQRQAIARAVIDKPAHATWQEPPDVVASESQTEESADSTPFETDAEELMSGETLHRAPLHRFNVAHRLASLGEFAVLVFGFADGGDLSTPVFDPGATGENPPRPFNSLDDLMYLAVFGQDRVVDIERNTDMTSPRFRRPEMYELVIETGDDGENTTEEVHWTRALHIPEGTLIDDERGIPAYRPIFHNLLNLDKILAGSGEGYWRGGYRGMVIRPPEAPGGGVATFEGSGGADSSELAKEISEYTNNMSRTIASTGRVEPLDHSIADPTPHLNAQIQSIVAECDIPKSVLVGQETADRATREDNTQWHETVAHIRNTWAGPVVARPFIDRLIRVGIIREPPAGGFELDWPPLDEPSKQEQAEHAKTLSNAITKLSGGTPMRLATRSELRDVLGWEPELGSEAPNTFSEGVDPADRPGPEVNESPDEEEAADESPDEEGTNNG